MDRYAFVVVVYELLCIAAVILVLGGFMLPSQEQALLDQAFDFHPVGDEQQLGERGLLADLYHPCQPRRGGIGKDVVEIA